MQTLKMQNMKIINIFYVNGWWKSLQESVFTIKYTKYMFTEKCL